MGRGKERMVICAKCGKNVRRDKAVFLEKVVFTNPAERKDIQDENYTRFFSRELAYCPACGRHLRIYEKKKQQMQRERQRKENNEFGHHYHERREGYEKPAEAKHEAAETVKQEEIKQESKEPETQTQEQAN